MTKLQQFFVCQLHCRCLTLNPALYTVCDLYSAGFTIDRALGQDEVQAPSIGFGRRMGGGNSSNCESSEVTERRVKRLREEFTGIQGAGPLAGVARGQRSFA